MELYLQFGYGMKQLSIDLAEKWGKATVILSPRDIKENSLWKWCREFTAHNINILFDPQCYYPKQNHKNLSMYGYHNLVNYTNIGKKDNVSKEEQLLIKIKEYNDIANTIEYIVPSIMQSEIDNDWFIKNKLLVDKSKEILVGKARIMTIALPSNALLGSNEITEKILENTEHWDIDGYYVVVYHPENKYLVDDEITWMTNLMDLCAGLKLQRKKVILGYANHQFLSFAPTKIDAIASGTWLNVRKFDNKFKDEESEPKQRNIWYYYPQALSEYKISFLDLAFNNGILNRMKPDSNLNDEYADVLFNGALPTSTSYSERDSHRHYLNSLKHQIDILNKASFNESIIAQENLLETAQRNLEFIRKFGILGQDRDFKNCIDINLAALQVLKNNRGFILEREWNNI